MKKIIGYIIDILIFIGLYYLFVKYIVVAYFPFVLSLFIVIGLSSLLKRFVTLKKWLGMLILFLFYVSLSILFIFIIFYGIQFFYQFLLDAKDYYDLYLLPLIRSLFKTQGISYLLSYSQQIMDKIFVWLIDKCLYILSIIPTFFSTYCLMMISSFFFHIEYDECKEYIIQYIPQRYMTMIKRIKDIIFSSIKYYLFTQLQLMVIVFIYLSFAFVIIRFDYPILLSFLLSFLDALPFIGVGIALLPMTVFYFIIQDYLKAIYILALYLLINITRTFLEPRLMKNHLKIPTIFLFVSMIIHIQLFGIIGLLISPITLSIFQSLLDNHDHLK